MRTRLLPWFLLILFFRLQHCLANGSALVNNGYLRTTDFAQGNYLQISIPNLYGLVKPRQIELKIEELEDMEDAKRLRYTGRDGTGGRGGIGRGKDGGNSVIHEPPSPQKGNPTKMQSLALPMICGLLGSLIF